MPLFAEYLQVGRTDYSSLTPVRFDPATQRFQTWTIPSGGGVVRHMMATADGNLVLALSGVNRVALVEVGRSRPSQ